MIRITHEIYNTVTVPFRMYRSGHDDRRKLYVRTALPLYRPLYTYILYYMYTYICILNLQKYFHVNPPLQNNTGALESASECATSELDLPTCMCIVG